MKLYTFVVHYLQMCWMISLFKFWTATIFVHAHLQVVYYNCVKFHKTPISRLEGVVLTKYTTPFSWKYKLNYLLFEILYRNGQNLKREIIQLIRSRKGGMYLVSATPTKLLIEFLWNFTQLSISRLEGVVLTKYTTPFSWKYKLNYLLFEILYRNGIPSCISAGCVLQLCKVS
jgi:hypothetical protein